MDVTEIFYSIQGEGQFIGQPTIFIRLNGCNLNCPWCDTKYSLNKKNSDDLKLFEVMQKIYKIKNKHSKIKLYSITGGEPLIQSEAVVNLVNSIKHYDKHLDWIIIETNGTLPIPTTLKNNKNVVFIVSPKKGKALDISYFINYKFEKTNIIFKFVINSDCDLNWIDNLVIKHDLPTAHIWLMPNAVTTEEQVEKLPMIMKHAKEMGYNVTPRLHIMAYGNKRGV